MIFPYVIRSPYDVISTIFNIIFKKRFINSDVRLFVIPTKIYKSSAAFLVDTSVCKIPRVDPFDKSVKHLLKNGSALECETKVICIIETQGQHTSYKEANQISMSPHNLISVNKS
jgi:hypothetical protein